jgi:hypothetical protein
LIRPNDLQQVNRIALLIQRLNGLAILPADATPPSSVWALICASSVGCRLNYCYGEDFVFANKCRQGGKEERNSDLLIDIDVGMGGDVDMAIGGKERDPDHQGAGQ